MKTICKILIAVVSVFVLSCSSTIEPKSSTRIENQLIPLTVGNWWRYQKNFGYDTTEYTEWHVQKVENRDTMITATIAYHTYRKGSEQDTLTSGIFYVHESDDVFITDTTSTMRSNAIPNKSVKYRTDSVDSRITQSGMYYIGSSDSTTVPVGTFYDVKNFVQFAEYGYPIVHGWSYRVSANVGILSMLVSKTRYELVEYSLVSNN